MENDRIKDSGKDGAPRKDGAPAHDIAPATGNPSVKGGGGTAALSAKTAAALSYRQGMPAPRITASATGRAAERMAELAAAHGVPVIANSVLAGFLAESPVGAYVPEETYRALAVIFAFLERAKNEKRF